jgi:pimeloyl-ACP methyl ester carboxylesterase
MSNQPLTLWLLNRAVDWDQERLARALGPRVAIGQRRRAGTQVGASRPEEVFVNEDEESYPGELMHEFDGTAEHAQHDEYFVPIPVKCVRDPRAAFWLQTAATVEGRQRLDAIAKALDRRFPKKQAPAELGQRGQHRDRHDASRAKDAVGSFFGDVTLNLVDSVGYYEILRRATQQTGAKNVLVGYSQGGTVARYLAYLDERIAAPGTQCIHGIVTADAPHRGSPLASSAKKPAVSTAAIAILLALMQWLPQPLPPATGAAPSPIWEFLKADGNRSGFVDFINELLDAEMRSVPEDDKRFRVWRTARKWASGLSGIPDLAFWDLDPEKLKVDDSVLRAIHAYPLERTFHGAVVGSNSELTNLIELLLSTRGALYELAGRLLRSAIEKFVQPASAIYAELVLDFHTRDGDANADYAALSRSYATGVAAGVDRLDRAIPPKAHDFVVPAVSQLLLDPNGSPLHLGNHVNPGASHLSGADGTGKVNGRSDEDLVVEMLRRM